MCCNIVDTESCVFIDIPLHARLDISLHERFGAGFALGQCIHVCAQNWHHHGRTTLLVLPFGQTGKPLGNNVHQTGSQPLSTIQIIAVAALGVQYFGVDQQVDECHLVDGTPPDRCALTLLQTVGIRSQKR